MGAWTRLGLLNSILAIVAGWTYVVLECIISIGKSTVHYHKQYPTQLALEKCSVL